MDQPLLWWQSVLLMAAGQAVFWGGFVVLRRMARALRGFERGAKAQPVHESQREAARPAYIWENAPKPPPGPGGGSMGKAQALALCPGCDMYHALGSSQSMRHKRIYFYAADKVDPLEIAWFCREDDIRVARLASQERAAERRSFPAIPSEPAKITAEKAWCVDCARYEVRFEPCPEARRRAQEMALKAQTQALPFAGQVPEDTTTDQHVAFPARNRLTPGDDDDRDPFCTDCLGGRGDHEPGCDDGDLW